MELASGHLLSDESTEAGSSTPLLNDMAVKRAPVTSSSPTQREIHLTSTLSPKLSSSSSDRNGYWSPQHAHSSGEDVRASNDSTGHLAGKPSHDSGYSHAASQSTGMMSGTTTPSSTLSMGSSSELFHPTTLKVHDQDAEALTRARQVFSSNPTSPLSNEDGMRFNGNQDLGSPPLPPAPLLAPIPSSPPTGPTFKSRMPANLALRSSSLSSTPAKDTASSARNSPLHQSMTFEQEQFRSLDPTRERREEIEMLASPGTADPTSFGGKVQSLEIDPMNSATSYPHHFSPDITTRRNIEDASFSPGTFATIQHTSPPKPSRTSSSAGAMYTQPGTIQKADYVIAVVGTERVGKTTMIGKAFKAWGLSEPMTIQLEGPPPAPRISRYVAAVDTGQPPRKRLVEILEIDIRALRCLDSPSDVPSAWPASLPHIDGVMSVSPATIADRKAPFAYLLHNIGDLCHHLPAMVIACKSDPGAEAELAIKPIEGNEIGAPYGIGLVELSVLVQQGRHKMRMSFGWMLKAISKQRRNRSAESPRTPVTAFPPQHPDQQDVQIQTPRRANMQKHSPAVADRDVHPYASPTANSEQSPRPSQSRRSTSDGAIASVIAENGDNDSSKRSENQSLASPRNSEAGHRRKSSVDVAKDIQPMISKHKRTPSPSSRFVTLEDLLERLSTSILGGTDNAFVNTFFLSYRRFCEPPEILSHLLDRWFEIIDSKGMARQYLQWCQIRMVITVAEWLETYPGDFATPEAKQLVMRFYASASQHAHLAHIAADVAIALQSIRHISDLDLSWSVEGVRAKRRSTMDMLLISRQSSEYQTDELDGPTIARHNSDVQSSYSDLDETTLEAIRASQKLELSPDTVAVDHGSSAPMSRQASKSQSTDPWNESKYSLISPMESGSNDMHVVGGTTRSRANTITTNQSLHRIDTNASRHTRPSSDTSRSISEIDSLEGKVFQKPLTLFYELSDLAIAIELCRDEWQLYSAIRPRDCFRQVLGAEKDTPVTQSAQHFNTISSWVSTLVLGPPKAKYRAQVYEKFCSIITQLIRLRNYSTCWAVTSGLNDLSIRRLGTTLSLVRASAKRELQDAMRLIDPTGSYKVYREFLKRDCDLGSKAIPFLGVITQDLTKIHAAHAQDQDTKERIHWPKYSVMAEAIAPLALYQARGDIVAGLPQSGGAQYLIVDTPRLDEDGLYRRSKHLEPDSRPGLPSAQNSTASSTGVRFKRLMAETMFGTGSSPLVSNSVDRKHLHRPYLLGPALSTNFTQTVGNITHL
ncbi:hypothetical protein QFC21_001131 [Naganishia friedmannii]|uniref:Uncharacterized protein n=1 Tax=Naganishia friedmannii TaxID=89922 RepID=A0ACC2W9D6_9TREE|nr:hypothetical protein QFC21_001131 [Naganishia friedmannii]